MVQVTRKKIYQHQDEDDEEDDDLLFSAVATASNWGSFISVKQQIHKNSIKRFCSGGELLAREHYACQLKHGRALLRLNMNHPTMQIDQSEHEQLDSSHLLSCIEQALT